MLGLIQPEDFMEVGNLSEADGIIELANIEDLEVLTGP